jgi:hypothetical protein
MSQQKWTAEAVTQVLIDPRYCLSEPRVISDKQWIEANVNLIAQLGPETYLATLLGVLRT